MTAVRERYRLDLIELQATCEANYARLMRLLPDMRGLVGSRRVALSQGEQMLGVLALEVTESCPYTTTLQVRQELSLPWLPLPHMELRVYHDARQCEALRFPAPAFRRGNPLLEPSERWAINVMLGKWLRLCLDRGYRFGEDCPPQVSRSHAAGSQRPD